MSVQIKEGKTKVEYHRWYNILILIFIDNVYP